MRPYVIQGYLKELQATFQYLSPTLYDAEPSQMRALQEQVAQLGSTPAIERLRAFLCIETWRHIILPPAIRDLESIKNDGTLSTVMEGDFPRSVQGLNRLLERLDEVNDELVMRKMHINLTGAKRGEVMQRAAIDALQHAHLRAAIRALKKSMKKDDVSDLEGIGAGLAGVLRGGKPPEQLLAFALQLIEVNMEDDIWSRKPVFLE